MTRYIPAIALAVAFLAAAAGLKYAESAELVSTGIAQRTIQVMIGLVLAGYANLMPKRIGSRRLSLEAEARVQKARRAGGWSLTIAGLAYAVIWAAAPLAITPIASMLVVGSGLVITVCYAVWACRKIGSPGSPGAAPHS